MYAPFAMLFPEESDKHRLLFHVKSRNPYGMKGGEYELYDLYPALQDKPNYDIFLNVVNSELEIMATVYCHMDEENMEIDLSLSEIHLQSAQAKGVLAAIEDQFSQARGQKWASWLVKRAEQMESAFMAQYQTGANNLFGFKAPTPDVQANQILQNEAIDMLMSMSEEPEQQEALIESMLYEMRQVILTELEVRHKQKQMSERKNNKIIAFPGPRVNPWQEAHWLDLHIALQELPEIWRSVAVPDCLTLTQLQQVIQKLMNWQDTPHWRFIHTSRGTYGPINDLWMPDHPSDFYHLYDLFPRKGAKLDYQYTPKWSHHLKVTQRHKPGEVPLQLACLDGALASPPEDCGGPEAYNKLQHILGKKRQSTTEKLLVADFNPLKFDAESIQKELYKLQQEWN